MSTQLVIKLVYYLTKPKPKVETMTQDDILNSDPAKCLAQMFDSHRKDPLSIDKPLEHFKKRHPEVDWDAQIERDPSILRDSMAVSALKLYDDDFDRPVAIAFERAGLDPENPLHWRLLLNYFCWAHFRPKRGRGAPELWSPERYIRLLQDEYQVRRDHPTFGHMDVCRVISKRGAYKRKGKPLTASRIKSALREARDPQCNRHLLEYVAMIRQRIRQESQNRDLSPDAEAALRRFCIEQYCKQVVDPEWRSKNALD
jgi:hypothetical protein